MRHEITSGVKCTGLDVAPSTRGATVLASFPTTHQIMKPRVLFIGDLNENLPEYKAFLQKYECIKYTLPPTKEDVISDFKTKYHDVDAIYGAWLGFVLVGGFRDEIVASVGEQLRIVSICSVGHEAYDGEAMSKRGIILTNVPSTGAAGPVADLVLYNTLASFRNFGIFLGNMSPSLNHTVGIRAQLHDAKFDASKGRVIEANSTARNYSFGEMIAGRSNISPNGRNAVIVGFGNIGKTIGARLSAIGMNIHYVKRTRCSVEQEQKLGFKTTYHANIQLTCGLADLVVVSCPLTSETRHLINADLIQKFEKPIRIINIGRGPIIDEQALVDGLNAGKVVFAGLDVFEHEPKIHEDLFNRQDVILTPHIGASTTENFDYTAVCALKNIDAVLLGEEPLTPVN